MHRVLSGVSLRSIADSFCKTKLLQHGRRNVADELGFCRRIASSIGDHLLGYGEDLTTKSIRKQIIDALFLGERGRASNLLLDLCHANSLLRADDFVDILKHCAKSPDPLFALETWRILEEREIGISDKLCLLMVQALCKGGYLEEAYNLINFIGEKHGTQPSLMVYNSFLGACSKMHNFVHADKCLDLMERRMLGKNEVTYTQLLKLAVCQQNLSAAHEIWKDYIKCYSPQILSLQKFIWSFTRLSDLKSAYKILQYMVTLAHQGNTSIDISSSGRLYSSRLDIPIPSNVEVGLQRIDLKERNEQPVLLKADTNSGSTKWNSIYTIEENKIESIGRVELDKTEYVPVMKILKSSFGDVIHACAKSRKSGLAEELMLQMQNLGVQPSSHTYDGFLRAVSTERRMSEGMGVLKMMLKKNLKPYNSTLAMLSVDCCKISELDLAEALLFQISNYQDPYPFNIFLEECDAMDQPERAVRMWAKMKQLKIQTVIRTYELLFSLFGTVNAPYEDGDMSSQVDSARRINAIEMDKAKNGVQHSHVSMKNLLKALAAEGMIRELLEYLQKAEDLFCHSDTYMGTSIYNTVLHALVEAKQTNLAIEIFQKMKSIGFQLNAATYTTMIDCCSIIRCYKSASALLSMMLRDGFYPTVVIYTALIKVLVEDGNFDEALNLFYQGRSEGMKPDVLLYNTVLNKACEKKRIDVIELIVEQMHREKIKPDAGTCRHIFSTYVECDFPNTAIEALQVLSMRMICQEDCGLEEKRAEFEDEFILAEDEEAESRIVEFFGGPDVGIVVALLNLRWCAIAGFQIPWSPNETLWARRLSTNYDTNKKLHRRY